MTWFKRIFLFVIVNIAVMATLSILMNLLGVGPYLTRSGIDYGSLMAFCLIWGMGGSFISLLLSKSLAKWGMGVKIIESDAGSPELRKLIETVHRLARKAGIEKMPQVGIYESRDINAFATGATKNSSLVAVSTGLLSRMDDAQVEGVLGHEITHIANGDMVTMALLQGVINAFVMFLARVISFAIANMGRDRNERSAPPSFMVTWLLEMVLMFFGTMVVMSFSRWREYRADEGGARLAGKGKMVHALEGLQRAYDPALLHAQEKSSLAAFRISGRKASGIRALFMSHPPLEERIAALQAKPIV